MRQFFASSPPPPPVPPKQPGSMWGGGEGSAQTDDTRDESSTMEYTERVSYCTSLAASPLPPFRVNCYTTGSTSAILPLKETVSRGTCVNYDHVVATQWFAYFVKGFLNRYQNFFYKTVTNSIRTQCCSNLSFAYRFVQLENWDIPGYPG